MYSTIPFSSRPLSNGSSDGDKLELANKSDKSFCAPLVFGGSGNGGSSGSGGGESAESSGSIRLVRICWYVTLFGV